MFIASSFEDKIVFHLHTQRIQTRLLGADELSIAKGVAIKGVASSETITESRSYIFLCESHGDILVTTSFGISI